MGHNAAIIAVGGAATGTTLHIGAPAWLPSTAVAVVVKKIEDCWGINHVGLIQLLPYLLNQPKHVSIPS